MKIHTELCTVHAHEEMSEEAIQTWLVEQVGRITGLRPNHIDIVEPFSSYGIDSVAAAGLSGELANWLGQAIAPTITWDYPSIKLLARHLATSVLTEQFVVA